MTTLLALDIGGTKVGWGIVEAGDTYEVTERGSIPTDAMRGGADVAARICELASSLVASHPSVSGVAVASAGVVDPSTGEPLNGLVLGGDSMFEINGRVLGKPHEPSIARERWLAQRGRSGSR